MPQVGMRRGPTERRARAGTPQLGARPRARIAPRQSAISLIALCLIVLASCSGAGTVTGRTPTPIAQRTRTPKPTPTAHTATPSPTATPTPGADADVPVAIRILVESELAGMTLDEKLGQMMLIETYYQDYQPDVDNMVRNLHAGAMIIYGKNMSTPKQLQDYIAAVQAHASIPLLITMDEEGGNVDRLGYSRFAPPLLAAQSVGASGNPQLAYQAGQQAGQELSALGINTDLAPVVDVRLAPNAIEGPRLFASDPQTVDTYAGRFLQGLQTYSIVATLKHWPGIGSITLDPHLTLPTLNRSRTDLESTEFAAFRGLLTLNPGMVMVTHVLVPAIDGNLPASLSPAMVQGVLRGELGYQGVVMTDSLYMKGISLRYNLGQAAVLAVEAGDDLLEGAFDTTSMTWMITSLKSAMQSGQISMARINESVRRILTLKAMHGLLFSGLTNGAALTRRGDLLNASFDGVMVADLPRSTTQ
ncbi:MAG: glycoside hydrolase family 3 [Ktedonobacterales bacterium]|nr:glycoside hydrolase family 3 [Ktedonobacterales bacterium]